MHHTCKRSEPNKLNLKLETNMLELIPVQLIPEYLLHSKIPNPTPLQTLKCRKVWGSVLPNFMTRLQGFSIGFDKLFSPIFQHDIISFKGPDTILSRKYITLM